MLTDKVIVPNPYGCSRFSNANKISDWVVIVICLIILSIYSNDSLNTYKQCIPGQDPDCSQFADRPDPGLAYPLRKSTVSFATINIVCPIVWIIVFAINLFIINCYHPLFNENKLWKIVLIKLEILSRSLFISVLLSAVTTDIIKNSVGRPRPNYLSNDDPKDSFKSFPSGHTSYIFSVFFILTLYLFHSFFNVRKIIYFQPIYPQHVHSIRTQKRLTIENIDTTYKDFIPDTSNESASDDEITDDKSKMILLMDGDIVNTVKVDKIMNVFNGDSYFFLSLFVYMKHLQIVSVLIALSPTIFAIYVGCSRLTDYKHHYSDVLCGALIGIGYSFLSFIYYRSEFYYGYQYNVTKIFDNDRDNKDSIA